MIKQATRRSILRWIHILLSFPVIGYIYSPFEEIPRTAPVVRYLFLPVLILTGLWLWKGPAVRRLVSRKAAPSGMVDNL
ncbi:hypothetical protein Pan153_23460 [Gimesia panareensis]|uniref:Uncharacterized protein n=1 Tax=Gimesia panareensis TaxID=2527978 RepID=A0A518FMW4_9PLAN|nr:hypothetical protein [Gimesia panareensis]QDV17692.1 hypothetical protein Pan153_23460 [Gimesia panareensis]